MKTNISKRILFISLLYSTVCSNVSYAMFYGANNYYFIPRFARDHLTRVSLIASGGHTEYGFNNDRNKDSVLNIYGSHAMWKLKDSNVPLVGATTDVDNAAAIALANLSVVDPVRNSFGKLKFHGRFANKNFLFLASHDFVNGFFVSGAVSVVQCAMQNISYEDLTLSSDATAIASGVAAWSAFKLQLPSLLKKYGVSILNTNHTGVGDVQLTAGWAFNCNEIISLDHANTVVKIEASLPVSRQKDESQVFFIPIGFEGHAALKFGLNTEVGFNSVISAGLNASIQGFSKQNVCLRMKTDLNQNGFIKLAQGAALRTKGPQVHVGGHLRFDRVLNNGSLMIGYTFTKKCADRLDPLNVSRFRPDVVNSDVMLSGWHRHAMHVSAHYRFMPKNKHINPALSIFYNRSLGGERIFKTDMIGGIAGIALLSDF